MQNLVAIIILGLGVSLSNCSRRNPLDHRDTMKDPLSEATINQALIDACTRKGMVYLQQQNGRCVTPAVACALQEGHYFDREKDLCLNPRDLCYAQKNGSEWVDGTCIDAASACDLKAGAVWSGKRCIDNKDSCLAEGYQWLWIEDQSTCRLKSFLEMCEDHFAPEDIKNTVRILRSLDGGTILSCNQAWEKLYYQTEIVIDKSKGTLDNLFPFATLNQVNSLVFEQQSIKDLYPLTQIQALTSLVIHKNSQPIRLQDFARAPVVTSLTITESQVDDIDSLASLTSLVHLNLSHNQISHLYGLSKLSALESVDLSYNPVVSVFYLRQLEKLIQIDFSHTPLNDSITKDPYNCPRGQTVARILDRFCSEISY